MRLAIFYIIIFVLFILVNAILMASKQIKFTAFLLHLFVFGIVSFPLGLYGKKYENQIKHLEIKTDDQMIEQKYRDYLEQWTQPRMKLSD